MTDGYMNGLAGFFGEFNANGVVISVVLDGIATTVERFCHIRTIYPNLREEIDLVVKI